MAEESSFIESVDPMEMLDSMTELYELSNLMQNFVNDQMLRGMGEILSVIFKLTNTLVSTDLIDIMERGLQDPELDKALLNPPEMDLPDLLRAFGDENVRKGIGIMMELIRAIGKAAAATDTE